MTEHEDFDVTVDGNFAIVPEWVLFDDISDRAVRLYAVLCVESTHHRGVSRSSLAARLRTSVDSVDSALAELTAIGAIS